MLSLVSQLKYTKNRRNLLIFRKKDRKRTRRNNKQQLVSWKMIFPLKITEKKIFLLHNIIGFNFREVRLSQGAKKIFFFGYCAKFLFRKCKETDWDFWNTTTLLYLRLFIKDFLIRKGENGAKIHGKFNENSMRS